MERKPAHEPKSAQYGSISLVKRMHQNLHSPPNRTSSNTGYQAPQESNAFDPESATLSTDISFLRGGKEFRSRDRISRFLDHSTFGIGVDIVLACLSLLFVSSYIAVTYTSATTEPLPLWLWGVELLCAGVFAIDFVFRGVYLSNHRLDYMLSLSGCIDLIVILPVLPTSFLHPYHTLWFDADYWRFVYPFRFVKCYLECKDVLSRCHSLMTPVRQFALLCYVQIVLIIAGAAGIIQIAETSDDANIGGKHSDTFSGDWTFFNSFFNSVLVFVTIQTPPADNVLAKVFIGVLVIVLILIVPYQVSKVLELSKSFTEYELISFKPSTNAKHIVLCGDLTPSRIDHFFHEVFHDDHDVVDINVVVLSDQEPSTAMIALLMDPFFEKRTSFIQGSILDVDDAERAAVPTADAIFMLTRRCDQDDHMASDHRTLMRVLAAKRLAPKARVFAQMHLSSNRHLLDGLDVKNALYFSEVMHSLLGQNCVCPGFSTLIYNLTSTSSEDLNALKTSDLWEQKYMGSASHELYSVTLPPGSSVVFGRTFSEVASMVYHECQGVILIAVQSAALASRGKLLLNPGGSYTCLGDEVAFVIAKNRREADQVMTKLAKLPPQRGLASMPSAWTMQRAASTRGDGTGASMLVQRPSKAHLLSETKKSDKDSQAAAAAAARRVSKTVDWKTTLECRVEPIHEDKEEDPQATVAPPPGSTGSSSSGFARRALWNESKPRTTTRVSVEDVVIDDFSHLSISMAHIVLCVVSNKAFPHQLEYLVGPLRVKALHHHRPIVVVTSTLPDDDQFESFRHFKHVYFVKGNVFHRKTLQRACIETAHKIVIMGDEGDISESGSNELLADASCIALHKTVSCLVGPARAPRIITELVNRTNVHFITHNLIPSEWFPSETDHGEQEQEHELDHENDPEWAAADSSSTKLMRLSQAVSSSSSGSMASSTASSSSSSSYSSSMAFARDFYVAPAFASGLTYSTSLCDSLMINQYFNPMIKNILREFIFASWKDNDYMTTPLTPPHPVYDPLSLATGSSPASSSLLSPGQSGVHRSSLFAVEVPMDFVGKTFEFVFHALLASDDILAIGLYRCRPDIALFGGKARVQLQEEHRSVPFGYVYVNPPPNDVVTGNDLLYVLSHKQPRWA